MTKDWESWKDEIKRLYLTEYKTLDQVQGILTAQGFYASIRAYRMKLDAWGIRKNTSTHGRKKRRIESPELLSSDGCAGNGPPSDILRRGLMQPCSQTVEKTLNYSASHQPSALNLTNPTPTSEFETEVYHELAKLDCVLPNEPVNAYEIVKYISSPIYGRLGAFYTLEVLLLKWRPDGTYLNSALEYISKDDSADLWMFHGDLFKIIDVKLGPHERKELTKACLKQLLTQNPNYWPLTWVSSLMHVVCARSWAARKSMLKNEKLNAEVMGRSFVECAPVVFAENILTAYIGRLVELMKRNEGVFETGSLKKEILMLRHEYMEIVNDFSDAAPGLDLDPSYYKFALRVSNWYEERQAKERSKALENLRLIISEYCGQAGKSLHGSEAVSDGMSQNLLGEISKLATEWETNVRVADPDGDDNEFRLSTANPIFQDLFRTWQDKQDLVTKIREYALIPLTLDHENSPIEEQLGPNQLFDLIRSNVAPHDKTLFQKAILVAFEKRFSNSWCINSMLGYTWLRSYRTSWWDNFIERYIALEDWMLSQSHISRATAQDILHVTTVITAKQLLVSYNERIGRCSGSSPQEGSTALSLTKQRRQIMRCLYDHRHLMEPEEYLLHEQETEDGVEMIIELLPECGE